MILTEQNQTRKSPQLSQLYLYTKNLSKKVLESIVQKVVPKAFTADGIEALGLVP